MLKHLSSDTRIKMIGDIINENFDLIKDRDVADVGAGEESITRLIANYANSVSAIDNSGNMLIMLREKCKDLKNINIVFSTTDRISIKDKSVDVVISISSFHDFPSGYENEMSRILKDNGIIIILDWKKEENDRGPPYNIRLSKEVVVNK